MAWLNHPKPVQVCQDRYINGLDQEKPVIPTTKGILDKNCVLRSTLQGLLKYESTRLQPVKSNLPVWTFLPCGRKKGLFGHVVAKSRKAWQTMELYPTWISEVHQTYPIHRISIWACREWLGHSISKKNEVKRLFFEWVIPRISFWLQIDYKLMMEWTTSWLIDYKIQMATGWLTNKVTLTYKSGLTHKVTDCKVSQTY